MTYRFTLAGEVPAKKNNRRTLPNGRSIPSKGYLAWHETALVQLILQKRARHIKQPLAGRLCIDITLTHGDLRRRDGDNGATSVLDTLRDAGIIKDDCWEICRTIRIENRYEKGRARCEIFITQTNHKNDYRGKGGGNHGKSANALQPD